MPHASDENLHAFRAAFADIPDAEIPAAYERFRRYARLAAEAVRTSSAALTAPAGGGTVTAGQVEPRTFTNTG